MQRIWLGDRWGWLTYDADGCRLPFTALTYRWAVAKLQTASTGPDECEKCGGCGVTDDGETASAGQRPFVSPFASSYLLR